MKTNLKIFKIRKTILLLFVNIFILSSCLIINGQKVEEQTMSIILDKSDKYSEEEIEKAVDTIIKDFTFPASTIEKISYTKGYSDGFLFNNKEMVTDTEKALVFQVQFYVDKSGDNPVLNPNTTYEYNWILEKDKNNEWVTVDFGF